MGQWELGEDGLTRSLAGIIDEQTPYDLMAEAVNEEYLSSLPLEH